MAPGLGFLKEVVVDQHFTERGRISRLMAAVALNPKILGLGIDEDTAVVFKSSSEFQVIGAGAVYVIDGMETTKSNILDSAEDEPLSVHNMKVHVLSSGESFSIEDRQPIVKGKYARKKVLTKISLHA